MMYQLSSERSTPYFCFLISCRQASKLVQPFRCFLLFLHHISPWFPKLKNNLYIYVLYSYNIPASNSPGQSPLKQTSDLSSKSSPIFWYSLKSSAFSSVQGFPPSSLIQCLFWRWCPSPHVPFHSCTVFLPLHSSMPSHWLHLPSLISGQRTSFLWEFSRITEWTSRRHLLVSSAHLTQNSVSFFMELKE